MLFHGSKDHVVQAEHTDGFFLEGGAGESDWGEALGAGSALLSLEAVIDHSLLPSMAPVLPAKRQDKRVELPRPALRFHADLATFCPTLKASLARSITRGFRVCVCVLLQLGCGMIRFA